MFHLTILSSRHTVYEGQVESVFFPGDTGEFEIMSHHAPVVSLLREGKIIVNWEDSIAIKKGMVKCLNNECVVLVDE